MKKIFILQNSNLSFSLDAVKIYQPQKYKLIIIINEFGFNIMHQKNQVQYYEKIFVLNNFEITDVLSIICNYLQPFEKFDVITNSEETKPLCGKIRQLLNLEQEDYARFYNKHIMKQKLFDRNGFFVPDYKIFDVEKYKITKEAYLKEITQNLNFPLFAKPTQLFGSINLKKLHSATDLRKWAESINLDHEYEINEFIEGTMYHCDSYIKNNEVLFTFISRNSRPCYDFTIGKVKGTIVLPNSHPDTILLSNINKKILRALGIPRAGVTHLEVIKTKEGKVYFIEIAHRSPGCLIPHMYQKHANIDTVASHYLLQIDTDYHPKPVHNVFAAWACYPKIPGKVSALNLPPKNLSSQYEIEWQIKVGDYIKNFSQFGRDYTGTIFMTNSNFTDLYSEFMLISELNLCTIDASALDMDQ